MFSLQQLKKDMTSEMLAILVVISAVIGLQEECYPNESLRTAFVPNDVVNLVFGAPLIIAATHEKLLLPGVLAYHIYSSLTYIIALIQNPCWVLVAHSAVVFVCFNSLRKSFEGEFEKFGLLLEQDYEIKAPARYGGVALMFWGFLFVARAIGMMLFVGSPTSAMDTDSAICIADIVIGAVWVVAGSKLYQHKHLALGIALLFQGSALFSALVLILFIRPLLLEEIEFAPIDVLVVSAMGLTVIFPFLKFYETRHNQKMICKMSELTSTNQLLPPLLS